MKTKVNGSEKRFFFLESRVRLIQDMLSKKIKRIQEDQERLLSMRPLNIRIIKKNPLLDSRDFKHSLVNQKLGINNDDTMNL
jgi:hypothetical protein